MKRSFLLIRSLVCAGMLVILTACSFFTTPTPVSAPTAAATPTQVATTAATAVMVTATSPATVPGSSPTAPAATPTVAIAATATAPAATATSAAPSPTGAASLPPVITFQSAASLTPVALTLPAYPSQLFWVAPNAPLPAGLAGAPLVARAENNLYPLRLDPPALGAVVPMPSAGDNSQVILAPDLSSAIALRQNNPATLVDLTGKVLKTFSGPGDYGASFSADGKLVAVTSSSQLAATIYDIASGKPVAQLSGFQTAAPVYSVGIVPGNHTIYWIARATLQLQDVASGQMGAKVNYQDFIGPFTFTPDGQHLILYVAGSLYVYALPDLKETAHLTLSERVNSLSVSPDGTLLVAGYGAGIKFFDLGAKGESLLPGASLNGPNDFSGLVSFSPDGRYLVSVHTGNIVNIWKVK